MKSGRFREITQSSRIELALLIHGHPGTGESLEAIDAVRPGYRREDVAPPERCAPGLCAAVNNINQRGLRKQIYFVPRTHESGPMISMSIGLQLPPLHTLAEQADTATTKSVSARKMIESPGLAFGG